jgi:hypothetical protein
MLSIDVERRPAGGQHLQTWDSGEQIRDRLGRVGHALEVVQDEQQPLVAEHPGQAIHQPAPLLSHTQHAMADETRAGRGHDGGFLRFPSLFRLEKDENRMRMRKSKDLPQRTDGDTS